MRELPTCMVRNLCSRDEMKAIVLVAMCNSRMWFGNTVGLVGRLPLGLSDNPVISGRCLLESCVHIADFAFDLCFDIPFVVRTRLNVFYPIGIVYLWCIRFHRLLWVENGVYLFVRDINRSDSFVSCLAICGCYSSDWITHIAHFSSENA
ncbi:hypothetical protein C491_15202 [Natronococcus amylolyticus DSM 10524]|uniref:Uncharacterized protein n=1 Tax=Natronococcus amylolyticus DSM 10524 TaxID=1227497 RepID=L9X4B0_9EURY|nr:hypothetical protein C491_15202 [Natronococcus amylolyticus DSM 10524]